MPRDADSIKAIKSIYFRVIAADRVQHAKWCTAERWASQALGFSLGLAIANLVVVLVAEVAGAQNMPVVAMNISVLGFSLLTLLIAVAVGTTRHRIKMDNIDREHSFKMHLIELRKGY